MPGHVAVTGRSWSLSLRRVCIAMPICRRLLKSFVAFARSRTRVKAGSASAKMIMMIATTTSNSINVKARGEFLTIKFFNLGHHIGGRQRMKEKKSMVAQVRLRTNPSCGGIA